MSNNGLNLIGHGGDTASKVTTAEKAKPASRLNPAAAVFKPYLATNSVQCKMSQPQTDLAAYNHHTDKPHNPDPYYQDQYESDHNSSTDPFVAFKRQLQADQTMVESYRLKEEIAKDYVKSLEPNVAEFLRDATTGITDACKALLVWKVAAKQGMLKEEAGDDWEIAILRILSITDSFIELEEALRFCRRYDHGKLRQDISG